MNQSEFEADLNREGYKVSFGGLKANEIEAEHAHDFNVRIMVIGGEITVSRNGRSETFHGGHSCAIAAGEMHTTRVGAQGVAYVAGRRDA